MVRGSTDHAPKRTVLIEDEDLDKFITKLRLKRNQVESNLKTCEDLEARQAMMLKIEQYNMVINEFGYDSYGKKTKAKF